MAELNIYQKLQKARIELQAKNIEKSGWNPFSKYKYFELSDFLLPINTLFDKYGLCSIISFDLEIATMTIYNTDNPSEFIVITSPMSSADLSACHPVQSLGAVETYQRRYLYITALEIVENDALDATTAVAKPKQRQTSNVMAEKGGIEREIKSKYDNSKCGFCGKVHSQVGDTIVLVGGKWGAKECFLVEKATKEELQKKLDNPLPEAKDIHGMEPGNPFDTEPPPPSDEDSFPF